MALVRRIGFIVEGMVVDGRTARLYGRCAYDEIRVGDLFTDSVTLIPAVTEEDYAREAEVEGRTSVSLRLERITLYRHSIDFLDRGMAAEIDVHGDGLSQVQLHDVLTNDAHVQMTDGRTAETPSMD
jgi:hypothetical protein